MTPHPLPPLPINHGARGDKDHLTRFASLTDLFPEAER